jgi:hypothetical protein
MGKEAAVENNGGKGDDAEHKCNLFNYPFINYLFFFHYFSIFGSIIVYIFYSLMDFHSSFSQIQTISFLNNNKKKFIIKKDLMDKTERLPFTYGRSHDLQQ